jgi:hypothetical protein
MSPGDNYDVVTLRGEPLGEMAPDKTGAASYRYAHRLIPPSGEATSVDGGGAG